MNNYPPERSKNEKFDGDVVTEYRKYANNIINDFRCGTGDYSFDRIATLISLKNEKMFFVPYIGLISRRVCTVRSCVEDGGGLGI